MPDGKRHYEYLGVDGLKWIFKKLDDEAWTGLM